MIELDCGYIILPDKVEEKTPTLRYRPISVLGVGGMGRVVKCDDTQLKRTVAVKFLLKDAPNTIIQRFHKEAKAVASLNHPNIVKVLDFGRMEDHELFLVMEYLPGMSLEKLIGEEQVVDIETSLDIVNQICSGLEHAHRKNIIHRDIKPSNVMLTEDHNGNRLVKLVDFGIVGFKDNLDQSITSTGAVIGSPSYISPEAAMAKSVDKRSDLYSLGCLFFELLTGKKPFAGDNLMETMLMHMNEEAPSLQEVSGVEFSEKLEVIVKKCLEKELDDRYQTVSELKNDIVACQNEQFESEPFFEEDSGNSIEPDSESFKVSPQVLALSTIAIVGISLMAAFLLYSSSSPDISKKKKKEVVVGEPVLDDFVHTDHEFPTMELINEGTTCVFNHTVDDEFLKSNKIPKTTRYNFIESAVKGFGLKYLNRGLSELDFKRTALNDDGLLEVAKFPKLRVLYLRHNPYISSKGIEHLAKSKSLNSLQYQTAKFGFDMSTYTALSKLESIELLMINNDGKVEASEIEQLLKLPKLDKMQFIKCEFGKDSFQQISKLPKLKTLVLFQSCTIKPGYLEQLNNPNLAILYVGTKISIAELNQLAKMKRLKVLRISNFRELAAEIAKVKKARPKLRIEVAL